MRKYFQSYLSIELEQYWILAEHFDTACLDMGIFAGHLDAAYLADMGR